MASRKPQLGVAEPLSEDGQRPLNQPPDPLKTNPRLGVRNLPQVPLPVRMRKTIEDHPGKE
jgi:hypothetical protein